MPVEMVQIKDGLSCADPSILTPHDPEIRKAALKGRVEWTVFAPGSAMTSQVPRSGDIIEFNLRVNSDGISGEVDLFQINSQGRNRLGDPLQILPPNFLIPNGAYLKIGREDQDGRGHVHAIVYSTG